MSGADALERATWILCRADPAQDPGDPLGAGISARVPGTVSGALRDALGEDAMDAVLAGDGPGTVWEYRTRVTTAGGAHSFVSAGVATVCELVVAGETVHTCDSAFAPWDVTVALPPGECEIALRVLPLSSVAVPRKPRARWLSPLVSDRSLRWRRTPLVGAIDWPGARPVLGPWGGLAALPVTSSPDEEPSSPLVSLPDSSPVLAPSSPGALPLALSDDNDDDAARPRSRPLPPSAVRARVTEDGHGVVSVDLTGIDPGTQGCRVLVEPLPPAEPDSAAQHANATEGGVVERAVSATELAASATVEVPVAEPRLWWPHGMGAQQLYRVRVVAGEDEMHARVGFRTVTPEPRDAAHRGLALRVNGVPVFARGAVWTGADPYEVAADPRRTLGMLRRLRDAGTSMVRIPGTSCYETEDFHRACDELGLMVWQDVALGPLDPPNDPEWRTGLHHEVRALASRLAGHPSTAVISGGTEVIQAPVLAGRPAEQWAPDVLLREIPTAVAEAGSDAVVVPSSPCSDAHLDAAQAVVERVRAALALPRGVCGDGGSPNEDAHSSVVPPTLAAPAAPAAPGVPSADTGSVGAPPSRATATAAAGAPAAPRGEPGAGGERATSSAVAVPQGSPVDAADGVCHYFGVGAYGRPLEDAVTRGVRFAAESLAFAVPPEPPVVRAQFGTDAPLDGDETAAAWRAGLARDPGAAWTFADTTNTYVHRLFLDRDSDPDAGLAVPARPVPEDSIGGHARRLELERATLAHVVQRTFAQWRAADSACRGALVLSATSTAPGAGWGVLDVTGRPTAAWYGMRRACAPVAVSFVPAGGDGLPVHVWNDRPEALEATLRLTVATVRGGSQPAVDVPVMVPAHGETVVRADLADGTFRDLDNAYGFGDREYDAVSAVLLDARGRVLARDAHLSGGPRRNDAADPGLSARWVRTGPDEWGVVVTAEGLARFVALDLPVRAGGAGATGTAAGLDTAGTGARTDQPTVDRLDTGTTAVAADAWGEPDPVAEDGYVHVLPGETVVLPVSGEVTGAVRAATRVRTLGADPVAVSEN